MIRRVLSLLGRLTLVDTFQAFLETSCALRRLEVASSFRFHACLAALSSRRGSSLRHGSTVALIHRALKEQCKNEEDSARASGRDMVEKYCRARRWIMQALTGSNAVQPHPAQGELESSRTWESGIGLNLKILAWCHRSWCALRNFRQVGTLTKIWRSSAIRDHRRQRLDSFHLKLAQYLIKDSPNLPSRHGRLPSPLTSHY